MATNPKPTADRQTVDALRGVLREIVERAKDADYTQNYALTQIADLARKALAATEGAEGPK